MDMAGVFGWGNAANNQGNFLYYNEVEKTFEYGFYCNDAQTAANYPPLIWYHVANTWDGTTQRIYVNGTLVTSRNPGHIISPIPPPKSGPTRLVRAEIFKAVWKVSRSIM